jgi:hypothetical protein
MNALLYMGPMLVIGGLVAMYVWERTCRLKMRVVVVKTAGGTDIYYVRKDGDTVDIPTPDGNTRTWPISKLATIPRPYPDLAGLLPRFLQREIQEAILIEGDCEPLLNRSPHREKIMSPDVLHALEELRDDLQDEYPDAASSIDRAISGVVTGPTRELVISPELFGAVKKSTVMKALASVSDDLLGALQQIRNQLARFSGLNSTYVYIGLVLIIILQSVALYFVITSSQAQVDVSGIMDKVNSIQNSLGIK